VPPFNDTNVEQIFKNIETNNVPWSDISIGSKEDQLSPEAKDFIQQLMTINPQQ
jgi:hypothetical protein